MVTWAREDITTRPFDQRVGTDVGRGAAELAVDRVIISVLATASIPLLTNAISVGEIFASTTRLSSTGRISSRISPGRSRRPVC